MNNLAPLPVVVPLGAAALLLFVNTVIPRRLGRPLALAAVLAEIALAAVLLHQAGSGRIIYWFGGWAPRQGVALGVSFTIDQFGAAGAFLGGIVVAAALVVSSAVDAVFDVLLLTTLAAIAGFCLTGDLFNMFAFFELMAVSAVGLAAYRSDQPHALRAALNLAITNSIGAVLVLFGITLLYARTGALNLAQIGVQLAPADRLVVLAAALVFAGFLIRAAVIPFHFWLIDTASSAPLPLAMILAGVLDTLGVYAVARVYWTVFAPSLAPEHAAVRTLLVALGAFSALAGGALSLVSDVPRRRLAFVMVSHTGILLVGVGCLNALGLAGAAMFAIGDGTIIAALFASLTLVSASPLHLTRRVGVGLLAVGGLAVAGLPLFATGLAGAAIEDAASAAGDPWAVPLIVAAAALSGAAVLLIAHEAWVSPAAPVAGGGGPGIGGESECGGSGITAGAAGDGAGWWITVGVAGALLAASVLATTLGRWVVHGAARFLDTGGYQRQVLSGLPAASGLPGPAAAAVHFSPTSLLADLIGVAGAMIVARLVLARSARGHRAATAWPVATIRRWHDGSIGDSAAWATIGTAAIALVLALALR